MTAERTPDGKVVLYSLATGQRLTRWPVDARAMLETGAWSITNPSAPVVEAPIAPAVNPAVVIASVSPDALLKAAEAAGVDPMPHVTQANAQNAAQSPTGAPLVIAPADGVSVAAPMQLPTGRTDASANAAKPPRGAR